MHEYKDGLIGLAIGDALGVPLINVSREDLLKKPVTGMTSGGIYDVSKGTWGLPTEVALAIEESFIKNNGLKEKEIMNALIDVQKGVYSIRKDGSSLGKTTTKALERYQNSTPLDKCGVIDLNENGSGAILMMYPVAFYAYQNKLQEKEIYEIVKTVTELTHKHEINVIGCYIFTLYLVFLLRGKDKYASLSMLQCCDFSIFKEEYLDLYSRILKKSLKDIDVLNIKTDGYIVSTVESVLYILLNSDNFTQSVLGAINLGGKTNITSSLVGCMASILYGVDTIPENWLKSLKGKDVLY